MPNQRLSCFRPITATTSTSHVSGNPTLTTTFYHTQFGLFALTWCRNLLGRSFHLQLLLDNYSPHFSSPHTHTASAPSFQLLIKPFTIWKRRGSKKLLLAVDDNLSSSKVAHLFWDLSRVKFGSRPEPLSSYYLAVVIDGVLALLVGDSNPIRLSKCAITKDAVLVAPPPSSEEENHQRMFLKREYVHGVDKSVLLYTTKATFGDKVIDISIECRLGDCDGDGDGNGDDPKLSFVIDNQKILQIKHLKWKFRGNDRIEIDGGILVQVSWDVRRWLFQDRHDTGGRNDGHALFMFRFQQKLGMEDESLSDDYNNNNSNSERNGMWLWSQSQQTHGFPIGFETSKRMKKSLLWSGRSSSSSSLSSASSSCSSSVMEWASAEENELKGPAGFSLVIHAWKN